MIEMPSYTEKDKLRNYSSIFSRSAFTEILAYDDYACLDRLIERYGVSKRILTYWDFLKFIYRYIRKYYRNEYVFKNEFLARLLIKDYGTRNTAAFSEFRVSNSIVDLALFNGESKAFEIKTEYDSPKRLEGQLQSYLGFFDKCYLIVPERLISQYSNFDSQIGIIVLGESDGQIYLQECQPATENDILDVEVVMKSLRTEEYKNIIIEYFGDLPKVSCFSLFEVCEDLMKQIPQQTLRVLIRDEIKKRKSVTSDLRKIPYELRQICLSMKIDFETIKIKKALLQHTLIPS